jgi:hypothetical protein
VINSIQQGMAEKLDFEAIVDLVGDKLREVFHTGDIGIRWHEAETGLMHYLYQYEHGIRQSVSPRKPLVGGPWAKILGTRQPVVLRNPAEGAALGVQALPGTDQSQSAVFVPILGSRVRGLMRARELRKGLKMHVWANRARHSAQSPRAYGRRCKAPV